jgi:hypothetical protein
MTLETTPAGGPSSHRDKGPKDDKFQSMKFKSHGSDYSALRIHPMRLTRVASQFPCDLAELVFAFSSPLGILGLPTRRAEDTARKGLFPNPAG